VIDPEALDSLEYTNAMLLRHPSQSSSRYDDDAVSTSTPDYASTISEEAVPRKLPDRREERPRSGILKLVGDPSTAQKSEVIVGDTRYPPNTTSVESSDIPSIDFGPTYSLTPDRKRPGTSGTMTQGLHDNSFSQSKENATPSPNEQQRQSYYFGQSTPVAASHMRNSSGSPQVSDTRSMAWQPGMVSQGQVSQDRQKVDVEEWVALRAAAPYQPAPYQPMHGHGRSKSHTPEPLIRTHSGDWTHLQRTPEAQPARPPSRPLSRPVSRGAGNLLDQRPTSLSAREQERVARVTGTPLIDLANNPKKKQEPSSTGLTAYIDHREKEKTAAKANRNTAAMQAEIDRRTLAAQQRHMMEMQQQLNQQAGQQMGQQMAMAQSVYGAPTVVGTPQGYSPAFAYSTPTQMQQMYQAQQGYFPQPSPMISQGMPGAWVSTPQQMQGPYFAQQPIQPQQTPPQAYGASFDQAQAAARVAHQQGQQGQYRRG